MNIDKIKNNIKNLKNKTVTVKVFLGRNKYEHFIGKIDKIYPHIFTIKTDNKIKTFSFSDIATSVVKLELYK